MITIQINIKQQTVNHSSFIFGYNYKYMSNIFLQLAQFQFKREALSRITGAETNKKVQKAIKQFFESGKTQFSDYADFLVVLLGFNLTKQIKQKLLIALVYFVANAKQQQALKYLQQVLGQDHPVIMKVKFFSFVFKSSSNPNIQKWIIKSTVTIIQNQQKVSSYAGIIEHFDQVIEKLKLSDEQKFQIYYKLTSYLEKHPVYKKLCSVYVIKALQTVNQKTAQSKETKDFIIKAIKAGVISDSALNLLNNVALKKNELYQILQILITGDFEKLDLKNIKNLQKQGLVGQEILRKMKIQAIPRLLSNVKSPSYEQVAQILNIKKNQVESYIIDAIKQGILKAKLDQFQQTVMIHRVNFRALRQQERAKLQKDISQLTNTLSQNLNRIQ